ncbi:MAG: hypothetical protein M1820_004986 [Bogoriella megaspora]|nr:MAG: hypothetical protein M1820_004986 [Bogoriella megaspora]
MATETNEKLVNGHSPGADPAIASDNQQTNEVTAQSEKPGTSDNPQQDGKPTDKKQEEKSEKGPAGGFDDTPIPHAHPGYTVKITFHRATNLPMADVNTLASDPYILATIDTGLPTRHKEDPSLTLRTPTVRRNTDPVWNCEWIVANIPSTGFKLKARIYDEDPADHDDRLGNAHITVSNISENWPGIKDQAYKIMKRSGSKRAYFVRAIAACFSKAKHMNGNLFVSIECLGPTEDAEGGGRAYTVGPCYWFKHYSPMLGRIANVKDARDDEDAEAAKQSKNTQRFNFQANQIQLTGPVPSKLYHRYVEFRPFVKGMFTSKGVRGFLLSKALHHQHARVYNFSRTTEYGVFPSSPSQDTTLKFLDLVHYDKGGRIFTYVITLDSLWRFTETGKEFGVDLLSKHTMHSDVSIYIAFSGEFFIRRLKHPNRPNSSSNPTHPPVEIGGGPPRDDPPKSPEYYELIIDNDSGTYRPNAQLLPLLRQYLSNVLPGLRVITLDCQADAEKMAKLKSEQRERKKAEGQQIVYTQGSRSGSVSSSDEEALDVVEQGMDGDAVAERRRKHKEGGAHDVLGQLKRDASQREKAKVEHMKGAAGRGMRKPGAGEEGAVVGSGDEGMAEEEGGSAAAQVPARVR